MANFVIIIDVGGSVTSDPAAIYPNMMMAMAGTLRSAAVLTSRRFTGFAREPRVICELIDLETRERREMVVRFDASIGAMAPVNR